MLPNEPGEEEEEAAVMKREMPNGCLCRSNGWRAS